MRKLHKEGKLDEDRVWRLQNVGFPFVTDNSGGTIKFSVVWDKSFKALKA